MSLFKHKIKEVISPENLKSKGSYLSEPTLKFKDSMGGFGNPQEFNILVNSLKNELSKIRWEEIQFITPTIKNRFKVILPEKLEELKKKIIDLAIKLDDDNLMYFDETEFNFYFEIDNLGIFNRVHYKNSLPIQLRNIGFGYKMYKALTKHLGYISSGRDASDSAKRIWIKLLTQDNDFNGISGSRWSIIIDKKLSIEIKKNIVENFLGIEKYKMAIDNELANELNLEKNGK